MLCHLDLEKVLSAFIKHFQTLYGDKEHYAMSKDEDVALENGDVYEEKIKPAVVYHKYTHEGVV